MDVQGLRVRRERCVATTGRMATDLGELDSPLLLTARAMPAPARRRRERSPLEWPAISTTAGGGHRSKEDRRRGRTKYSCARRPCVVPDVVAPDVVVPRVVVADVAARCRQP